MKCNDFMRDFKKKIQTCYRNFEEVKTRQKFLLKKKKKTNAHLGNLENFKTNKNEEVDFAVGTDFPVRSMY